jgi:hypothetical protein
VESEQAAGRVLGQHIGPVARRTALGFLERLVIAPEQTAAAGDADLATRHLAARLVAQ